MAEAGNFTWDFDRPSNATMELFTTFSVGIFQWQQKASGKELKKSKAMSRVLGYTSEADRVYEKAIEICARLNRERASAAAPPSWLRKQFSVPKPAGLVIERTSDDFTGAQVRAMRLKVMKEYLLPAGFVVGRDATYTRRDGDQIHLINFQGATFGHEFTVNVGFQYAFIPPLSHQRRLALADFHLLDCIACTRIASLLSHKTDKWFDYGNDRDLLVSNLTLCATTCLTAFQQYSDRWRDPAAMLADFSGGSFATVSNADWRCQRDLALGWVELKTGRVEAAESRLAKWTKNQFNTSKPLYMSLRELVAQSRTQHNGTIQNATWKDWVE